MIMKKRILVYAILAVFILVTSCETKERLVTKQEENKTELPEVTVSSSSSEQDTIKQEVYDAELDLNKTLSEIKCLPDSPVKGKENDIIGEWKLVQIGKRVGFGVPVDTIDISCDNVYFEFENDSILQVLGKSNLLKQGSYKYTYSPLIFNRNLIDSVPKPDMGPNLGIKINDSLYLRSGSFCFVKPSKMHILHHFGNTSVVEIFIRTK